MGPGAGFARDTDARRRTPGGVDSLVFKVVYLVVSWAANVGPSDHLVVDLLGGGNGIAAAEFEVGGGHSG